MTCRIIDMRHKEVINVKDGCRLGFVSDVEFDTASARVTAIIIYGRLRLLGILGREDDIVVRWQEIQIIGDETILVHYTDNERTKKHPGFLGTLFGGG